MKITVEHMDLPENEVILRCPVLDEEMLGVLSLLKTRVPEQDYCFFEHALACALSWFPGESEEFHQKMHHWRRTLEE